ncbi:hypothetical protein F5883DRAFT_1835 [Diaporthe sp. PMI_573]|nr:hypothetical protein F5883DRAFT_1835 [Diaporthaceae sp. PMI_573]
MQLFTFFTTLALGCGAMAQAPKGISNFYCQIDHVDLENSDGICAAAGGRLEPLNGCCVDVTAVPDAAAVYAQGCGDNRGTVAEVDSSRCRLVL